jgi:hypothetical protein
MASNELEPESMDMPKRADHITSPVPLAENIPTTHWHRLPSKPS